MSYRTQHVKARLVPVLTVALLLTTVIGCSSQLSETEVEATAYAKLTATAESWTPTPSNTPTPTATATPTPTATSTPRPTATATPRPTATPPATPTATPRPPTAVPVSPDKRVMKYLNDSHPYRSTEEQARATLIRIWNSTNKLHEAVNAVDAYVKTVEPVLPKLEKVKPPSEAKAYHDHYVGTIYNLFEAIKAINWGIVQNNTSIVRSAIDDANKNIYELDKVDGELQALADKYGLYFNGNTGKWEKKP